MAKKEQIELQNQIARRERIPIEDVLGVNNEITDHIAAIIKASGLPVKSVNEISEQLRKWHEEDKKLEAGVDKPG
jgi:hypothetical protein